MNQLCKIFCAQYAVENFSKQLQRSCTCVLLIYFTQHMNQLNASIDQKSKFISWSTGVCLTDPNLLTRLSVVNSFKMSQKQQIHVHVIQLLCTKRIEQSNIPTDYEKWSITPNNQTHPTMDWSQIRTAMNYLLMEQLLYMHYTIIIHYITCIMSWHMYSTCTF